MDKDDFARNGFDDYDYIGRGDGVDPNPRSLEVSSGNKLLGGLRKQSAE